jgi:hypothetical protein
MNMVEVVGEGVDGDSVAKASEMRVVRIGVE